MFTLSIFATSYNSAIRRNVTKAENYSAFRRNRVIRELLVIDCDPMKHAIVIACDRVETRFSKMFRETRRGFAKYSFISGRYIGNIRRET